MTFPFCYLILAFLFSFVFFFRLGQTSIHGEKKEKILYVRVIYCHKNKKRKPEWIKVLSFLSFRFLHDKHRTRMNRKLLTHCLILRRLEQRLRMHLTSWEDIWTTSATFVVTISSIMVFSLCSSLSRARINWNELSECEKSAKHSLWKASVQLIKINIYSVIFLSFLCAFSSHLNFEIRVECICRRWSFREKLFQTPIRILRIIEAKVFTFASLRFHRLPSSCRTFSHLTASLSSMSNKILMFMVPRSHLCLQTIIVSLFIVLFINDFVAFACVEAVDQK